MMMIHSYFSALLSAGWIVKVIFAQTSRLIYGAAAYTGANREEIFPCFHGIIKAHFLVTFSAYNHAEPKHSISTCIST